MKIQVLAATAVLALFASTTASAAKLTINSTNSSTGAIAVGDTLVVAGAAGPGGVAGFLGRAGGRARAGSEDIRAARNCGCKRTLNVRNSSNGAVAIGNASAGSTSVSL